MAVRSKFPGTGGPMVPVARVAPPMAGPAPQSPVWNAGNRQPVTGGNGLQTVSFRAPVWNAGGMRRPNEYELFRRGGRPQRIK